MSQPKKFSASPHRLSHPATSDKTSKQKSSSSPPQKKPPLKPKPYGFVSLPAEFQTQKPVWHDGKENADRLSGEIRFELTTLTPLLVGWERAQAGDQESDWPLPSELEHIGRLPDKKSVLCPLRAPWGKRPVIIPGDSLKGLLRHELGALLGAPMERVAERSYSYRPNALFTQPPNPRLIARLAQVPANGIDTQTLIEGHQVRVPTALDLLPAELKYDPRKQRRSGYYRFDNSNGAPYRGGQGAGDTLNSKSNLHKTLTARPSAPTERVTVPATVQEGYLRTLRHLTNLEHGHFSERHPDVSKTLNGRDARKRILDAAQSEVFQPGDLIWVEWDTIEKRIVSLGWHYYYRWAYTDSVRKQRGNLERPGLFPLSKERTSNELNAEDAPVGLSAVRRLFGYTGDNEGSEGIGTGNHSQLMGRVSLNAALEVVAPDETESERFLAPTFLRELGMPRPSAVEHYLKQPYAPNSRPSDKAMLVTYGDAEGYDKPGELAGRKFYLDRADAYTSAPWKDALQNHENERSTLALEASKPGRRFRFTLRFRALDFAELAAVLVALCPDQFNKTLGGDHSAGYCSKLGYARPLGWGSVRIEAKNLLFLREENETPTLKKETELNLWVKTNYNTTSTEVEWLGIHRHKHPDAADYPLEQGRDGDNIYTYHSKLRSEHSRERRYPKETP